MLEKNKHIFKQFLKTVVPLFFGLLVFVLIFKKLDFNKIMSIARMDVNYWIIALSLPFGLLANIIRAYRWRLLIYPLGYRPKASNLIYAFLGNYGVNLAFPRLGEVWRCTMVSRYEKVPFTALIGTMITDRIFDLVPVSLIVVVSFFLNVPFFKIFIPKVTIYFTNNYDKFNQSLHNSPSIWIYLLLAIILVGITIWFFLTFFKEQTFTFIRKIKATLLNIWEGIRSISRMKDKWMFIFYTFLIWFGYFLYFYICFYAFPFTRELGWNRGLIAFGISSIAMIVPVQAGIGVWHLVVITIFVAFGVNKDDAGAFVLCVHTIQAIIFTALFGLFGILALSITNKGK